MVRFLFSIDKSYWLLVFPIFHMTIPWLHYKFRAGIPFSILLLWLMINLFRQPKGFAGYYKLRNAFLSAFICFLLYYFLLHELYVIVGYGSQLSYAAFAAIASNGIYLYVCYIIFRDGKYRELRFLTILFLVGFSLAGVAAVRGMGVEGLEGARAMIVSEVSLQNEATQTALYDALTIGLGRYEFVYYCAMLIAPLSLALCKIKFMKYKLLIGCTIISSVLCIRGGGLGTPIVVAIFGLGFFFLWKIGVRRRSVLFWLSLFMILGFSLYAIRPTTFSFMSGCLRAIGDKMEEGSIKLRVISMADAFDGDKNSYAYERFQLQLKSFNAFCDNPIVGIGAYEYPHPKRLELGGHSMILDKMGQQGIIGFFSLVIMLVTLMQFYKTLVKFYLGYEWLVMPMIAIITFVFAGIANPIPCVPGYFFVLFPGLAQMFSPARGNIRIHNIAGDLNGFYR